MKKKKWKQRKGSKQTENSATRELPHKAHTKMQDREKTFLDICKPFSRVVKSLAAIIGFTITLYALWPRISMSPYSAIDAQNPFKTPFILENTGNFAIHDVIFSSALVDVTAANGAGAHNVLTARTDDKVARLRAGDKTTIGFAKNVLAWDKVLPIKSAISEINVSFRPSFWPRRIQKVYRFRMEKSASGELIWLPEAREP